MIGLNIGSGQRPFESVFPEIRWINVDKVSREGSVPDICCDGTHLPYEDTMADYFVLGQVYEHFGCGEAYHLIKEAHRVLRKGGSLIISVPNMMALAQRWVSGQISEYIFMVNTYGAYMGNEEDRHKWGTTPESLATDLMKAAPWHSVRPFDNRVIPGMSMPLDWWITCLEAVR